MIDQIRYARNTTHWKHWWHGYQYGAFYIFPPEEVMTMVDRLREHYDPESARTCRAHISLSEPLGEKITQDQLEELQRLLKNIPPFTLKYGPLKTYLPHPGVTFAIAPEAEFDQLRKCIHCASMFDNVPIKRSTIPPHLTIAEFISVERTHEIMKELEGKTPTGTFECSAIELAVPNEDFYFERVFTIPLGT